MMHGREERQGRSREEADCVGDRADPHRVVGGAGEQRAVECGCRGALTASHLRDGGSPTAWQTDPPKQAGESIVEHVPLAGLDCSVGDAFDRQHPAPGLVAAFGLDVDELELVGRLAWPPEHLGV